MLSRWKSNKKYYAIDPWLQQENYLEGANVNNNEQQKRYEETVKRLSKFGGKAEVMRMFSSKAADIIPDDSLDFIYIDARHDYKAVFEDLTLWYPKVRVGGIIAGHDFCDAHEIRRLLPGRPEAEKRWEVQHDGTINWGAVKGAVMDFTKSVRRQVVVTYKDTSGATSSWYFRK
jgi:hypothetical protein